MLNQLAKAGRPLEALVQFALEQKGASLTNDTVQRYASLLEAAILADEGESLDGNTFQDFVQALDGERKFESAIDAIGATLNASPAEISQFKEITSAVSDVRSGVPLESVQLDLVAALDELGEEQDDSEEGLYAHLDDDTRIARLESDRVFGAEDEPSHIAPENKLGGDQVDD
ncbi:hypothetical protein OAA86_06600 [Rhodospirillales bacterium]|nr:hypothetical protein [Rhodospirillales bacterium]